MTLIRRNCAARKKSPPGMAGRGGLGRCAAKGARPDQTMHMPIRRSNKKARLGETKRAKEFPQDGARPARDRREGNVRRRERFRGRCRLKRPRIAPEVRGNSRRSYLKRGPLVFHGSHCCELTTPRNLAVNLLLTIAVPIIFIGS